MDRVCLLILLSLLCHNCVSVAVLQMLTSLRAEVPLRWSAVLPLLLRRCPRLLGSDSVYVILTTLTELILTHRPGGSADSLTQRVQAWCNIAVALSHAW